ncbi:MAG TPA: glucose-6-phosphate dehydrogenase [Polyangiaceae bacterium]
MVDPCVFVVFGASGDLTRRKLMPALYGLACSRQLPAGTSVVGFAMNEMSDDDFRAKMHDAVAQFSPRKPIDEDVWRDFASRLHYVSGRFEDGASFRRLGCTLHDIDGRSGARGNRIYYLAVPPSVIRLVVDGLAAAGLVSRVDEPSRYTRIVVEKPFGRDLESAEALNADLHRVFDERQIFRIDHYLGKETVQNLVALRFGNAIFEPLWNRSHIDHVQITVAEDIGVEGRGRFYEEAGALRDIVQNHMLQLLMLTAMEPSISFTADEVRDEKIKVLRALEPIRGDAVARLVVRGQYAGYRQEPNVSPTSNVETFVAMRVCIDSWRFAGVPFYLRTGKRLAKHVTTIGVCFRNVPRTFLAQAAPVDPDVLVVRIQPDEGISLRFVAKQPGATMTLRPVAMDFSYGSTFGGSGQSAYERLLIDAMNGDPMLFARADEVTAAWRFVTPILEAWSTTPAPSFPSYAAGTWGPQAAVDLIARDGAGRSWLP